MGMVYDEAGAPVMGATVAVRSLDASVLYRESFTTCGDGAWRVSAPEGANLEILASKPGWSERRRVGSFIQQATGRRNIVDFGVQRDDDANEEDRAGAAYYLTDRPELEVLAPATEGTDVAPAPIEVRLRVSEVLEPSSRAALADAIALWPTDEGPQAAVRAGSVFLGRQAVATWDDAGTELTLRLDAPLRAGRERPRRYEIGVLAGPEPIRDASGLPLGIGPTGEPGATPPADAPLGHPFRLRPWTLDPLPPDAGRRWTATHATTVGFATAIDAVPPALASVFAYDTGDDAVIALRFSEPMAAFDGTPDGGSGPTVLGQAIGGGRSDGPDLARRYTFRLSERANDVDRARLNGRGGAEPMYDPRASGRPPVVVEFALAPAAVRLDGALASAAPGEVVLAVGPVDPHVVTFTIKGRAGLFGAAQALGARAAAIADPAGNVITEAQADRHTASTAL